MKTAIDEPSAAPEDDGSPNVEKRQEDSENEAGLIKGRWLNELSDEED